MEEWRQAGGQTSGRSVGGTKSQEREGGTEGEWDWDRRKEFMVSRLVGHSVNRDANE